MIETLLGVLTLASMVLVVYHHVGYPVVLRWLGGNAVEPLEPRDVADDALPSICILIPAHNEARYVADKVRNVAALDYPEDKLRVILACDGCTDDTAAIARAAATEPECAHLRFEVLDYDVNRGKVAVLNDAMGHVDEPLVAMSDVSALISMDALRFMAAAFDDESVGVASGYYRLLEPGSVGEAAYWQYQNALKAREAALGATLGAPGAFYVIRRSLFTPLEADTINDDFVLPMRIVAAGYRATHLADVNAVELEGSSDSMDQARRRRIAAGNTQQLVRLRELLLPRHGGVAFAFVSGKALRVVMPYLMLLSLLGSVLLATSHWFFALAALGQGLVYAMVALVALVRPARVPGPVRAVCYLVNGHLAGLIGSLRYLVGLERGRWSRISE